MKHYSNDAIEVKKDTRDMGGREQERRSLDDIKMDVVRHDLRAIGLRLIALTQSVSAGMTQSDVTVVQGAISRARHQLLDTESQDLSELRQYLTDGDDIPF